MHDPPGSSGWAEKGPRMLCSPNVASGSFSHVHIAYLSGPAAFLPWGVLRIPRAVEWRPGYCVMDRRKIPLKHPCDQKGKTAAPPC